MLTAEGFVKKSYDDYLGELEQQARELFGEDANLSETGPLGKFIRLQAYGRAEENELAEAIYLSGSVDNAEGLALDYVVKNSGMMRLQAIKATTNVTLSVTPGKTISAGLILSTSDGIEFVTTSDVVDADNDGSITVTVEAMEAGLAGNVPANTITVIVTPIAGLLTANNAIAASGGRDQETDKELRDRHASIGANGLSSSINGIRATILEDVSDVTSVTIIENAGNVTDGGGRPAKSFEAVVFGGSSADVAKAILKAKPAGIKAHGTTSVIVQDDSGNNQTIGFTYATISSIVVYAEAITNASFPENGVDLIRTEIIKYIGGLDADGTTYTGLKMGAPIISNKLLTNIIANVPGVEDVTDLEFAKDGGPSSFGNVTFTATQIARTNFNLVSVAI